MKKNFVILSHHVILSEAKDLLSFNSKRSFARRGGLRMTTFSFFFFVGFSTAAPLHADSWMTVKDDIADVRTEPVAHALTYDHDPLQETQVLKNELVRVLKIKNGWAYVRCVQQMEFNHHNRWEGYPGWIQLSALQKALGKITKHLEPAVKDDALRQRIVDNARLSIGAPYFWGGRSVYDPNNKTVTTGVDCSGLVNLAYWNAGWAIPRDAHEQFLKAARIEPLQLKPGDVIFLSNAEHNNRITHVLLMATATTVIEAPQTGELVREISLDQRLGISRTLIHNGDRTPDGRTIYFGRFFPTELR